MCFSGMVQGKYHLLMLLGWYRNFEVLMNTHGFSPSQFKLNAMASACLITQCSELVHYSQISVSIFADHGIRANGIWQDVHHDGRCYSFQQRSCKLHNLKSKNLRLQFEFGFIYLGSYFRTTCEEVKLISQL